MLGDKVRVSGRSRQSAWRIWSLRTTSIAKSGRHIFRSFFQEYLDKVETYRQIETYLKAIRKRSMWVEPLFGEAKEFHRLRRFRLRLLRKVNIEGVMVAAGQNLKRLIQHRLAELFSLLKFPSQGLISLHLDFFNRLYYCTTLALFFPLSPLS
jgi:Transposase DDE domain